MIRKLSVALALAALFCPRPALATRLVVALEEELDGKRLSTSETEVAVIEALKKDERWVFVDPEQSRKVRKAAGQKSLLDTSAADLVTSLTADLLLIGKVELTAIDPGPFKDLSVYRGTAQVELIAVDSAEIVNAFRVSVTQRDFSQRQAQSKTAGDVARAIAKDLQPPAGLRYQLEVALDRGMSAAEAEEVARCIKRTTSLEKVDIAHYDAETLLLDARGKTEVRALAAELGQRRADGCSLSVIAYSARQVRLRYGQTFALELLPSPLIGAANVKSRDRWIGAELARGVAVELARAPYLRLATGELANAQQVKEQKPGRLVLSGTFRAAGARTEASVELTAIYRRRLIAAEKASCATDELGACIQALSEGLTRALLPALKAHPADVPLNQALPSAPPEVLAIDKVELDGIYPSRIGHYHLLADNKPIAPIGLVHLRNTGDQPITRLQVLAELPGLSEGGLAPEQLDLAPGATKQVPIFLRFNQEKLAAQLENRSAILELDLRYDVDDFTFPLKRRIGVMVFEKNAVNWSDDKESVAAFVSPRSPAIVQLADAVQAALQNSEQHPLAVPIGLFEAISTLKYRKDPDNPFSPDRLDNVLYPSETLQRGGGDCDDLAVLYASMLQAAGVSTMLVQTTGHVFVALATEIPPSNAAQLTIDPDAVIEHAHTLWVPIETTQAGKSFSVAWATAARELRNVREAGKKPVLIRVKDAWRRYPPVDLSSAKTAPPPALGDLQAAVDKILAGMTAELARATARLEKSVDPRDLNRYGVLLAQAGKRDQAKAAFEKSREKAERVPVLNNLANLELIEARPESAYALYEKAISLDDQRLEVRVNAIFALHSLSRSGDDRYQKAFVKQVLELNQRDPGLLAALQSRLPSIGKTGSANGAGSVEGLSDRLAEILRANQVQAEEPLITRSQAGEAGLEKHVSWLN